VSLVTVEPSTDSPGAGVAESSEERSAPTSAPPPGAASVEGSTGEIIPLDADDTRATHFGAIARSPVTLVGGGLLVVATGGALAAAVGPLIGLGGAAGAFLVVALIVFLVASKRAESDFFRAYARARGLELTEGRGSLAPATPLLRRGDRRYTKCQVRGELPGGEPGIVALYTYEETSTDSKGNRHTTYVHFTVAVLDVPEFAPYMAELFAQRRFGFRFLDGAEDVFRRRRRVEHESEEVDRRYEIFCGARDDVNRARQVLSPQFLVWLSEHSPEAFAFECVAGALVCNVKGHKKSAAELDSLCTGASAVAERLREEAVE
jgi:hypothetical protein